MLVAVHRWRRSQRWQQAILYEHLAQRLKAKFGSVDVSFGLTKKYLQGLSIIN